MKRPPPYYGGRGGRPSARSTVGLLLCCVCVCVGYMFLRHHRLHHEGVMTELIRLREELARHAEVSSVEDKAAHGGLAEQLLGKLESKVSTISSEVADQIKSLEFSLAKLEMEKKEHDLYHKETDARKLAPPPEAVAPIVPLVPPAAAVALPVSPASAAAAVVAVNAATPPSTALLVIASHRAQYLQQCLASVVKFHPRASVAVVVSEDGSAPDMAAVVDEARAAFQAVLPAGAGGGGGGGGAPDALYFKHVHFPDGSTQAYENGYFRLCAHFKWALDAVFAADAGLRRVIVLEEDLQVAPDFFEYFLALAPLLDDPQENLLAVSAFNDNGLKGHVADPARLYRSDFFPGLGWMLTRDTWTELSAKWPRAYWDDWLREPVNRRGRHIIRPEVSRSFHFGWQGVSNAQFGGYLQSIQLNSQFVRFSELDLSYLSQARWDAEYWPGAAGSVQRAKPVSPRDLASLLREGDEAATALGVQGGPEGVGVRCEYADFDDFGRLAGLLGIMDNIKANVPRTAYKGVVTTFLGAGRLRVHLVPSATFTERLASIAAKAKGG